jgi:hypothetical protein
MKFCECAGNINLAFSTTYPQIAVCGNCGNAIKKKEPVFCGKCKNKISDYPLPHIGCSKAKMVPSWYAMELEEPSEKNKNNACPDYEEEK